MLVSVNITKRKLNHYGQHIRNIIIKATVRNVITAGRVQALHSASPFPPARPLSVKCHQTAFRNI